MSAVLTINVTVKYYNYYPLHQLGTGGHTQKVKVCLKCLHSLYRSLSKYLWAKLCRVTHNIYCAKIKLLVRFNFAAIYMYRCHTHNNIDCKVDGIWREFEIVLWIVSHWLCNCAYDRKLSIASLAKHIQFSLFPLLYLSGKFTSFCGVPKLIVLID